MTQDTKVSEAMPSEWRIVVTIWPILLASAVGLLPFTLFTTFLVPIAEAVGQSEAAVGSLRGLGGVGAVVVGVALAPLIGRILPAWVAGAALALLSGAALVGAVSWYPALLAFCLLTGVSNAMLYPALSTAAADRFGSGPAAARAATLVMTAQTLASTLGGPLIVLPTLVWGWQGGLVVIAVLSIALVPLLLRYARQETVGERPQPVGYVAAFGLLARIPGALTLVVVAFARAAAFMGHLAFLAPLYGLKFGLTPTSFAFVWGLSGGSFFVGHLIAGRVLNTRDSDVRVQRAMIISLFLAVAGLLAVYFAPYLPVALLGTSILSASHAVVAAAVVTLLVRRSGDLRGTALSLNTAGMSLGLFVGTALAGAGLALAGYVGATAVGVGLTLLSLAAAFSLQNRPT